LTKSNQGHRKTIRAGSKTMKKFIAAILLIFVISCPAFAIIVSGFQDTDTYIKRAKDIVVAECVALTPNEISYDGIRTIDVNILKILKGNKTQGRTRITTIYKMEPNNIYLLYSPGGSINGTDFCAIPQLSVVEIPRVFNLDDLNGKDLKEQIQCIFSRRLYELEQQLKPMLEEKELLETGIAGRKSEWYKSKEPVKIGAIVECNTQSNGSHPVWLEVDLKKLEWSHNSPGKSGSFYSQKITSPWSPYWEFSPCDVNNIEDLAGKMLHTRFYGLFTPGGSETALRMNGPAVRVEVGQVFLARTVDEPKKIYIIQVMSQAKDQEQMTARYAEIKQ
jgi:hypothetical protein